MPPLRVSAAGSSSTIATASMKPAPNATSSSMTRSSRTARRVTARAPSTLPAAATSAYSRALDTRQEVRFGVAGRVLQHFLEQPPERLADVRSRAHARSDQVIAAHREVLHREGGILRADRSDGLGERRAGSSEQSQQIVRILARVRQPAT